MQAAQHAVPATVALAVAQAGSAGGQRYAHNAGANEATRRECHRGHREVAAHGSDTASAWRHQGTRPRPAGTASRHPTAVLQRDSVSNHATDWNHLADLRSRAAARPTGSLRRCGARMGDADAPRRDWVSRPGPLACGDCSRTQPHTELNVSRHMNPPSCP
jgi:hypothetical protein